MATKEYSMPYEEPYFSQIFLDKKKILAVSGNDSKFDDFKKNTIVKFTNKQIISNREFSIKITSVNEYNNYEELINSEDFLKLYPSFNDFNDKDKNKLCNTVHPTKGKVKAIRFIRLKT
jgi:ASC-1-like (ASCH) protein